MKVVAMLNQKGGVGKSSTCHHLSGTLAAMGHRVLLLDNDPQSSLSQGFWGPVATKALDPAETIAGIYAGNRPFPDEVIKATGVPGIDLISGSRALDDFNSPHPRSADYEVQTCLRTFPRRGRPGRDARAGHHRLPADALSRLVGEACWWRAITSSSRSAPRITPRWG